MKMVMVMNQNQTEGVVLASTADAMVAAGVVKMSSKTSSVANEFAETYRDQLPLKVQEIQLINGEMQC